MVHFLGHSVDGGIHQLDPEQDRHTQTRLTVYHQAAFASADDAKSETILIYVYCLFVPSHINRVIIPPANTVYINTARGCLCVGGEGWP